MFVLRILDEVLLQGMRDARVAAMAASFGRAPRALFSFIIKYIQYEYMDI